MGLFYDLLFNTVSRPLIEATGAQVPGLWCCIARVGASGLQGWASALGPRKLTLRCLASLAKKLFYFCFCFVLVFSFHLNVFLRTGKIKQNPKVFAPSPEPARGCLSPSLPSIGLSFSLLSTYMGWGSGWVGAFWGSGPGNRGTRDRHCFSVGVCCCRCPLPLLTSATELATLPPPSTFPCRVPVTDPKNVFVSLFVLFVVGFILVLVSVFF